MSKSVHFMCTLASVSLIAVSCRTRTQNQGDSFSNSAQDSIEDKIGLANLAWVVEQATFIESGIETAVPYDFNGFHGTTCKQAFQNSTLSDSDQASLVGILHYLEDQKKAAVSQRAMAVHEQAEAESLCTTAKELKTPFLGIPTGVFKADPEIVSKREKKNRMEKSTRILDEAKLCVLKHDALVLKIDQMR